MHRRLLNGRGDQDSMGKLSSPLRGGPSTFLDAGVRSNRNSEIIVSANHWIKRADWALRWQQRRPAIAYSTDTSQRGRMAETPEEYGKRLAGYVAGLEPLLVQEETAGKLARLLARIIREG